MAHDATSSTIVGDILKDTHSAGSADDPTHVCKSFLSESSSAKWARRSAVVNEQ